MVRAYTPSSSDEDMGIFELLIKVYRANEHPDFPEGGEGPQHLKAAGLCAAALSSYCHAAA